MSQQESSRRTLPKFNSRKKELKDISKNDLDDIQSVVAFFNKKLLLVLQRQNLKIWRKMIFVV